MADKTQTSDSISHLYRDNGDETFSEVVALDLVSAHGRIHEGRYFSTGYYNAAVANAASIYLLVQSSTTLYTHIYISGAAGGDATLEVFEDTTTSANGTAITPSNHNRSSSKVFGGTVTHTPTITANGTQLAGTHFIPAGQKVKASGGSGEFPGELILGLNKKYLFKLTNISGVAKPCSLSIEAYQPLL